MQKASWDSINYAKLSVQMAETLIPSFITLLKGILADFCVPYCIEVSDAGGGSWAITGSVLEVLFCSVESLPSQASRSSSNIFETLPPTPLRRFLEKFIPGTGRAFA